MMPGGTGTEMSALELNTRAMGSGRRSADAEPGAGLGFESAQTHGAGLLTSGQLQPLTQTNTMGTTPTLRLRRNVGGA